VCKRFGDLMATASPRRCLGPAHHDLVSVRGGVVLDVQVDDPTS
jgi:hypothetical protein